MPLQLSPLLWEDIDAFGVLDEAAMENWTFARLMDTSGRPRREFAAEWTRKDWDKDDKAHWLKVTDTETDELVAVALWRLPLQNEVAERAHPNVAVAVEETQSKQQEELTDAEARTRKFWAETEKIKKDFAERFVGSRVHSCESVPANFYINQASSSSKHTSIIPDLQLLVTHPSHRRRGAGSMLVKWGCD